jgi:transcription initiation factor TFIIE subunit alpha|tara:strand:- start:109 stop:624 length:516 start_codon:yes stop_codon:yes gene_type:complete
MRLTNTIIESVVKEVVGDDAIPLVEFLKNNKNISEFKIAEVIKREVNATRNLLYRLYENNLVSFMRKKDKKKGWYIYYWTFNPKQIKYLFVDLKKKKLSKLNERIDRENEGNFFGCQNKCIRLNFDQATDFNFKCPECGSVLDQENNEEIIEGIKKEIKEIEKELKTIEKE